MTEYRVLDKHGLEWSQRRGAKAKAVASARKAAKNWPDRAPFTVQRCEWVDVPLEEVTK